MDIFGLYSNHTYDHYIFSRPDEPEHLKNMLVKIAKPYVETFGLFLDALHIQAIEQFVLFSDPERAQAIERKYPHINKKYIESFNELKDKIYSESAELGIPSHELAGASKEKIQYLNPVLLMQQWEREREKAFLVEKRKEEKMN